ncbi:hypothetical protein ACX12L_00715 [Alicycliphilus sp. T452]
MPLFHPLPSRTAAACMLGLLAAGCVAVPGDPYYDGGGYYSGSSSMTVYEQPGVIYTAPPLGWRDYPPPPPGWREDAWRERQWREAQQRRDAQRREFDRRREADRREAERREADRRREMDRRAKEERLLQHPDPNVVRARREQFERDRRAEMEAERERRNQGMDQRPGGPRPDWR